MKPEKNTLEDRRSWFAFCLLLGLTFIIYSNSFTASWHLDDYANITHDSRLQLKDLRIETLWNAAIAFLENPKESRPLSRITFAVNWYFDQDNPWGYHAVNLAIHALAAFFLFLAISELLSSPNTADSHQRHRYLIALLSTLLWAINPIQTQAVTYIVQRMAALATMFYILGIYLYIKARTSNGTRKRGFCFLGCLFCAVLALASKENAATLPLALVLVEFLFFQNLSDRKIRTIFWATIAIIGIAIVGLGVLIFFKGDLQRILSYNFRYFSPGERLLTEPRIIIYYLSQIFYPVPTRLSIEHDIAISTSFLSPWTTLPAIILSGGLIATALFSIKKRPVLSFAILFFFLNHVIESSVIGLELIFEHRNYLPSLFVFVPVAAGISYLLDTYRDKNKLIYGATISLVVLLLVGFGAGTYIRNLAWQSEKSLWEDAIAKAPNSGRAWHNLALGYYVPTAQLEKALVLFRKALSLEKNNIHQQSIIYSNMASIYYQRGDYEQAVQYWTQALHSHRNNPKVKYLLGLTLLKMGNFEGALKHLDQLAAKYPSKTEVLNLQGVLAVLQGNFREALSYFRKCFKLNSRRTAAFFNAGAACSLSGHFQRAEWFFKTYLAIVPNDKFALLWLAQNSINSGRLARADIYLHRLLPMVPLKDFGPWLMRVDGQSLYNDTLIAPRLNPMIRDRLSNFANLSTGQTVSPVQKK